MFTGSMTALITPFNDGGIDEAALKALVRHQLDNGTHGLVSVGTTGEACTLTKLEYERVVDIVAHEAGGQVPVIAGAGSNNPEESKHYAGLAAKAGANAVLHVVGYYNRPNQEGIYQHFKSLHETTPLPILAYNVPPRTIIDILPTTMARIAELDSVIGVKDATADLARPLQERRLIKKDFCFLSGEDPTAVAYNANGGHGCISVSANVAPALCAQLQEACARYDFKTALQIQLRLMPLHQALFTEPSPAGAKYACSLIGLNNAQCRLPIVALRKNTKNTIEAAMSSIGLI